MNFNAQIAEAFKMFQAILNKTSQNPTNFGQQISGMNMNESIFGAGFNQASSLQNAGFTDDMLMQAFGLQKTNKTGNSQSVESFAQRAESLIAKGKGALEAMKASGNSDVWVAETDSRVAMLKLKEEINAAIETASDADKAKLQEIAKQLEQAEQAQTDARVAVLDETLDADRKALDENCPDELGDQIYNDAEKAKTKAEIEKSISDLNKYLEGCNKALGQVKTDGIKQNLKEKISAFNQKLVLLQSRSAGLKPEKEE